MMLINSVIIFLEFQVLPEAGGQDDQPMGFFETASIVKSHYQKLQEAAVKNGQT